MNKKNNIINQNRHFTKMYNRAKFYNSSELVVYIMENRFSFNRTGIVTSKKIGIAVKRNRARRIIKEAYREIYENLKSGYDVLFVAKKRSVDLKSKDICRSLIYIFNKAHILK
ncbi:MAG: ribonuclease P protein component [Candidatus Paraimprobicoccus trichonymphae]|uniref:Ribonuclease P protein component n=1 Tax=Candidatus Paraimprobicoccus trichonymphae TaxID=3033793 RepID=A0AA48I2L4_9FIRM|nr:MAG: ribonuclease P protein component [Candidatus Paraimprobicoccus trichonymphae]